MSARDKWLLGILVLSGIFFRVWILETAGITGGGTTYYYREMVRGMEERGELGIYPYRADAFAEFPEIVNDPTPLVVRVDRTLGDYGIRLDSDSRFMEWTPLLRYPPGFPIVLFTAHQILGGKAKHVILFFIVLNGLMIGLTFHVAWMLFGRRDIAWGSTALNAFWIYTAKNSVSYDPASLLFPVIMLTCYAALKAQETGNWKWILSISGLTFFAANLRADTFFLSFFVPLALWFRKAPLKERMVKTAVAIAVALALWLPWSYHNLKMFNVFRPFPAGAGHNMVCLIGRYAPESGFPDDDIKVVQEEFGKDYVYQKLWASDVTYPDGIARDRKKLNRSLEWIKEHPARFTYIMFVHMRYFFFTEENAIEGQIKRHLGEWPGALAKGIEWSFKCIEPLAMLLAAWSLWIFRSNMRLLVPVLLLWGYVLPHMPLWVEARYFKAAWPIVLILSTAAALTIAGKRTEVKQS